MVLVLAMAPGWVAASDKATIGEQFRQAVRNGQLVKIKALVAHGVDVNAKINSGYTVIMYAIWRRHLDVVKFLIDRGANVKARNEYGQTALIAAAMWGNLEIVKLLID